MKLRTLLGAMTLFGLLTSNATAQPLGSVPRAPQDALKAWGLSDDQAKRVSDLYAQFQTVATADRAQLRVYRAQIDQLMLAASPDLKAVNALVDKQTALRGELEKQRLALEVQVHQVIGDALYAQLRGRLAKRFGDEHRGMMGARGWGQDGPRWWSPPTPPKS